MKKYLLMVMAIMLMAATSVYGTQKSEVVKKIQPFSELNVEIWRLYTSSRRRVR